MRELSVVLGSVLRVVGRPCMSIGEEALIGAPISGRRHLGDVGGYDWRWRCQGDLCRIW